MAASPSPARSSGQRWRRAWMTLRSPRWQPLLYAEVGGLILLTLALLPGGFDYLYYFHPLAQGCTACTYNPYFAEWFVRPLGLLEWRGAYLVLIALCLVIAWWGARRLGGSPFIVLVSPTFLWVLWLGQIDILAALGLALAWWSLHTRRLTLAGLGLLLLATKPQLGGFAILALAWWGGPRTLIIPVIGALASLLIYGADWPLRWLGYTPQTTFAGDAWFYISPLWLLVTLLGVFIVRGRRQQLQYIVAATLAGAPFLGAYSFFVITLFPLRWWEAASAYLPFAMMGLTGSQWWLGLLLAQPLLVMARLLIEARRSPDVPAA